MSLEINDEPVDIQMRIGNAGEAFFATEELIHDHSKIMIEGNNTNNFNVSDNEEEVEEEGVSSTFINYY